MMTTKKRTITHLAAMIGVAITVLATTAIANEAAKAKLSSELALSRMTVSEEITPETTALFGERIDVDTGSVSFSHVDVALKGNSELAVEIRRSFRGSKNNHLNYEAFGDWSLDVPKITSATLVFNYPLQYRLSHMPNCGELSPRYADVGYATVGASQYWSGDTLDIPGVTTQKLRQGNSASGTYTRLADNWHVSCDGSDMIAISPSGDTYTFSVPHIVPASEISVEQEAEIWDPNYNGVEIIRTFNVHLQVSRIEDRFGNVIQYHYEQAETPSVVPDELAHLVTKLVRIESNDGLIVHLNYQLIAGSEKIVSIDTEGKSWEYDYNQLYDDVEGVDKALLATVTRPDSQQWLFDISFNSYGGLTNTAMGALRCQVYQTEGLVSTLTHPSGAKLEFIQAPTLFGRSQVPVYNSSRCFTTLSMREKKLYVGDEVLSWTYEYSQNAGSPKRTSDSSAEPQALNGLPFLPSGYDPMDLRSTLVTAPDGSETIHVFDRTHGVLEGSEVLTLSYDIDGVSLLQSKQISYLVVPKEGSVQFVSCKPSQYPVPSKTTEPCSSSPFDNPAKHDNHVYPERVEIRTYDATGTTLYETQYQNYNAYGKPELVVESGPSGTQYTRTTYVHDENAWVLNLPTQVERSSDNMSWRTIQTNSYYDSTHASAWLLKSTSHFGKLFVSYAYHSDGNLARETYNAPERYVAYAGYTRGVPTQITLPGRYNASAITTATQVVNSRGEVTSTTNFNGDTTSYSYDVMGRVTQISPPAPFTPTTIDYSYTSDGFTQVMRRGDYEKRIEMDGLLRPVLTIETDVSQSLSRYVQRDFNAYNKVLFESYPSWGSASSDGLASEFDGLQRPVRQFTTVDGVGIDTEYWSGNRVATTNGRGYTTVTTYQAFGQPQQEAPTLIETPDGEQTRLTYNNFGQPTVITQGGVTETRVYDNAQRLCRVVRPDVGHTVYAYNDVGDVLWQANGAAGSASSCDTAAVGAADKMSFSYDYVGNIASQSFGDGSAPLTYTYDAQGLLLSLSAGGGQWQYTYNALGLPLSEQLTIDGQSFTLNHSYNSQGQLQSLTYPSGRSVTYAPNAFGQASEVGSYLHSAHYTASGQVAGFTYGNGLTFNQDFNAKQLPISRIVADTQTRLGQHYSYDANQNLTAAIDLTDSQFSLDSFSYDSLDRLTGVRGWWGSGSFHYDALSNITSQTLGGKQLNYQYASNNRLTSVTGSVSRSFSYDSAGNVLNNGARSFSFNQNNQLLQSGEFSFAYDGYGRRTKKAGPSHTQYSIYDASGVLRSTYSASHGFVDYYYLGSQLIAKYADPNAQLDSPGYTGHIEDDDLELVYMQARYYDPVIGRFYSNDPVGWTPSNPVMSFNRYLYVNNNPYKYTDPNGEFLDAIVDIGFIAYDLYDMATNGVNATNSASLGANVAGLFIPGATGLGLAARAGDKAVDTISVTSHQALRKAKNANGIPRSAQPDKTIKPGTPEGKAIGLDSRNVKQYEYTNSSGQKISIRQDKAATYGQGGKGDQQPHFNAGEAKEGKLSQHHYYEDKR